MRFSLFVSAVFAASLFAGGALADRPGDDSGRTTRMPNVREMRPVREAREASAGRPHEAPQTKVRENQTAERLRARGDMVDRYGASASSGKGAAGQVSSIKSQRAAEKALERFNAKKNQVINCAPTDDSCGKSARIAEQAAKAGRQAAQEQGSKQRAEVQKKIDELRAEKLRERIMKSLCEKKANMCSANL